MAGRLIRTHGRLLMQNTGCIIEYKTHALMAILLEVAYFVGKWSLYLLVFVRFEGHILKPRYSTKYVTWSIYGNYRYTETGTCDHEMTSFIVKRSK